MILLLCLGLMAEHNIFRFIHVVWISGLCSLFLLHKFYSPINYNNLSNPFLFVGGHWGCLSFGSIMITVYIHSIYCLLNTWFFCNYLKLNCWVIWWLFVCKKLKNNFPSDWIILRLTCNKKLNFLFSTVGGGKWKSYWLLVDLGLFIHSQQCLWWEEIFKILEEAEIITFFLSMI